MPGVVVVVTVGFRYHMMCARLVVFELVILILQKCRVEVFLLVGSDIRVSSSPQIQPAGKLTLDSSNVGPEPPLSHCAIECEDTEESLDR